MKYTLLESGRSWAIFSHGDLFIARLVFKTGIEHKRFHSLEAALDYCV